MSENITKIEFDKSQLFANFSNRCNKWLTQREVTLKVTTSDQDWFGANVDNIARKLELILSIISYTPPCYSAQNVRYELIVDNDNQSAIIADSIERYILEESFGRYLWQSGIDYNSSMSDNIYADIKSIALKESSKSTI